MTAQKRDEVLKLEQLGVAIHLALVSLAFAARGVRGWRNRSPTAAAACACVGSRRAHHRRRDGARNTARSRHPSCLAVRRPAALHHLSRAGDQRARATAGAERSRGQCAGAHRRVSRHAAGLPDWAARRYCRHAVAPSRSGRRRRAAARWLRRQRASGHRGLCRHPRLDDLGRSQAALRRAVHPQPVLPRDEARPSRRRAAIIRSSPATG